MTYEIIQKIVKASGVTTGEKVLIHFWGEDKDKEIANKFMIAVASVGATPTLLQQSREINKRLFSVVKEDSFGEDYFDKLSSFDAVLDLFTYQPIILGYEINKKQLALYRKYIATLFSALMKSKRFTQIRIPTQANAEEAGLDPQDYIKRMTDAYDIDYSILKTNCEKRISELSELKEITIKTGEDYEISFAISNRNWHIDAGNGDMPCGEVYIAPIENETNGNIFFEKIYVNEHLYTDVVVSVQRGKITCTNNGNVNAWLKELNDEDKVVCELGFGMNPNIKDVCGYTVLDEKMIDTFHIAIGANTMFGGCNASGMHEDFICTSRYQVEVTYIEK